MFLKLTVVRIRVLLISLGLFTVLSIYTFSISFPFINVLNRDRLNDYLCGSKYNNNVATCRCRLPILDPFKGIHGKFSRSKPVTCDSGNWTKVFSTDLNSNLIMLSDPKSIGWERCCYQPFGSGNPSPANDDDTCVPILDTVTHIPSTVESILVFCTVESERKLVDMFLLFRTKGRRIESKQETKFNIVLLGLDSVSRMNFMRRMPMTAEYLRNKLMAIDMEGYVNVASSTFTNFVPILTGLSVEELATVCWPTRETQLDKCPFIWKNFSQAGYYTSFLEDVIALGAFEYVKKGFKSPPTDDYVRDLMSSMNRRIGHSGVSGYPFDFCLGPRLAFDVLLDKMKKMAVQLKQPYFQLAWASAGFHQRLGFPHSADESLLEALKWFQEEGYLERTILIFLSDHGQRYGRFRQTKQGALEEKMPFLYFVLPRWFQEQFPEAVTNMHLNRKRLSSPFDLHETLQDLLHIQDLGTERRQRAVHARGISHFSKIPWNRSCDDAGIPATWCPCVEEGATIQSVSISLPIVINGSKLLVDEINSIVSASKLCATVQLQQILNADVLLTSGIVFSSALLDAEFEKLTLTIETVPGNGIFQGTLARNGTHWAIFGSISRINAYGDQSHCVKSLLRNYCFCIVQN